jgi:hypothetical protein
MPRRLLTALVLAGITGLTLWRVTATHSVFSPTWDEPAHIYAGYEYLAHHRYEFDKSHPPLARIAFAFPLRHAATSETDDHERIGDVLMSRGSYMAGIEAARRGNLIFLVAAIAGLVALVAQRAGIVEAVIAAVFFALLPPVLAHAAIATTDLAVTALFAIALAVLHRWSVQPDWPLTAALAVAVGVGLLTKFSFPVYFGLAALALFVVDRRLPHRRAVVAAVAALVVVWAGYFFRQLPRFFTGFAAVLKHSAEGHGAYFMGEVRYTGWWEYFPVILAIKTPVPFLLLAGTGAVYAWRSSRHRLFVVVAVVLMLVVMPSRMNLGVRHILPVYVPLAALAAIGAVHLWRSRLRWSVPLLGAWMLVNSVTAHPDYLPWMNVFAGRHPERVVLDSNFDWGQDVLRLRDACRALQIGTLGAGLFGTTDLQRIGMPPTSPIDAKRGGPGWYAVSEGFIIPAQVTDPAAYRWLTEGRSFRRIGKTIRLYHVPLPRPDA